MEVEPAPVVIGTAGLTAAEVVSVARHGAQVTVGDDAGEDASLVVRRDDGPDAHG